jgi:hypothetical protein
MSSQMSAVELLKLGDQERAKPFLNLIWPQLLGTVFGIGSAAAINFGTRRPVFSGKYYVTITIPNIRVGAYSQPLCFR